MEQSVQKKPSLKQLGNAKWLLFLALPLTLIFDLLVMLTTRSGCLAPGCVSEFFRTSSMSLFILNETIPMVKK
jgi:hypothetical protein